MWLALRWPSRSRFRAGWSSPLALSVESAPSSRLRNVRRSSASQASDLQRAVLAAWVFRRGSRERMVVIALLAAFVTRGLTEAGPGTGALFAFLWAAALASVAAGSIKRYQSRGGIQSVRPHRARGDLRQSWLDSSNGWRLEYLDSVFNVSAAATRFHASKTCSDAVASDPRVTTGSRPECTSRWSVRLSMPTGRGPGACRG